MVRSMIRPICSSDRRSFGQRSCASIRSILPLTSLSPSNPAMFSVSTRRGSTLCRGRACRAQTPVSGHLSPPSRPRSAGPLWSGDGCPSSWRRRRQTAHPSRAVDSIRSQPYSVSYIHSSGHGSSHSYIGRCKTYYYITLLHYITLSVRFSKYEEMFCNRLAKSSRSFTQRRTRNSILELRQLCQSLRHAHG